MHDGYFEFNDRLPHLTYRDKEGMVWPLNWRVYVHGLLWIARDDARINLRNYRITAHAFYGGRLAEDWRKEQEILGE